MSQNSQYIVKSERIKDGALARVTCGIVSSDPAIFVLKMSGI